MSGKFKHRDTGFKYFIGWKYDNFISHLCIILLQMSGYIKYFGNDGKRYIFNDSR